MKRYLAAALASLLLIPLLLLTGGFALPARYAQSFPAALQDKCALLDAPSDKPRLILLGGSAVAFGVDSSLLESLLPQYRVINFGLYAALGTRAMLNLSLPRLREGDIVVLMPEQQAQTLSDYLGTETLWQAADGNFSLLAAADWQDVGAMAGQFPLFAGRKIGFTLSGGPSLPPVYRRDSFNEKGDIDPSLCPANRMLGGSDPSMPISFDTALPEESFWEMVNRYAAAAEDKGAVVWYHFPPMNKAAVESGSDPDAYCDFLRSRLNVELAGSPHTCLMESGWFYDTNFHLNSSGRQIFTGQLARDLKAMLGDASPTIYPEPAIPAPNESAVYQGDDRDADCFLYEASATGWEIVGIAPQARTRSQLVLPTRWQNAPVTGLQAGFLAGCESLRTLVIQPNITALPDGAFAGCPQLEQVYLLQADPTALLVGQDLLLDSTCTLAVPAGSFDQYCLSYGWAPYAARLTTWTDALL